MAPAKVAASDLDQAIGRVGTAAAEFGTSLFDLDAARQGKAVEAGRLRGISAARWVEASHEIELLWIWYQALTQALESIRNRRKGSRRQVDLTNLWADLNGPVVELPPDAVAEGLLNPAPIASVLKAMSAVFEKAAETITSLFAAEDVLMPRLAEFEARLIEIERDAESLKLRRPSGITETRNRLRDLAQELREDPLSIDLAQIHAMSAEVDRISAAVQSSANSVFQLQRNLDGLRIELDDRKRGMAAARPAVHEAREKIAQVSLDPLDLEALEDSAALLAADIARLEVTGPADPGRALCAVEALSDRLSQLTSAASAVVEAARLQMNRRRELRGLLDAYRSKAQAIGRAEDVGLDQCYRAAHEMLYSAPCDLNEAERLVTAYQTALTGSSLEDRLS